jgi:hypothetical protein
MLAKHKTIVDLQADIKKLTKAMVAFDDRLAMLSARMTELFRGGEAWNMAQTRENLASMKEFQIHIYQQIEELNRILKPS